MEKDLNKVRRIHRVGRVVTFNSATERERFMMVYGDLIHNTSYMNEARDVNMLYFTIKLEEFKVMVRCLELIPVVTFSKKTKYWKMREAVV